MAESYRRHSTYNYSVNNPIRYTDPDGMKVAAPLEWESNVPAGGTLAYFLSGGQFGTGMFLHEWSGGSAGGSGGGIGPQKNGGGGGVEIDDNDQSSINAKNVRDLANYIKAGGKLDNLVDFLHGKIGLNESGPGGPTRKYLKNQTNAYFGAIESQEQYQLDHANWVDEFKGTTEYLSTMIEYFDYASNRLGGASYTGLVLDNLSTIKDIISKLKDYNPTVAGAISIQMGLVGTAISNESARLGQFLDIYNKANSNYSALHKNDPGFSKGVTVNVNVTIGTNGRGYTNMSIYDISTHRYLSGGQIKF